MSNLTINNPLVSIYLDYVAMHVSIAEYATFYNITIEQANRVLADATNAFNSPLK